MSRQNRLFSLVLSLLTAMLLTACGGSGSSGGGAHNHAPVVGDITLTTFEGNAVTGTLPGWDADGDDLSFTVAVDAGAGIAVISDPSTGAFSYAPNAGAFGTDTFTIAISDGVETVTATITVIVEPIPLIAHGHAPSASAVTISTGVDQTFTGTLPATDADGHALTFSISSPAANGVATVTDAATGAFTYAPATGFSGTDSFAFQVTDGVTPVQAVVTVNVVAHPLPAHNHPPVTFSVALTTDEDTPLDAFFPAADVDGDPLTFSIMTNGTVGTAALTNAATGAFTYTPTANLNGPDSITFRADDGMGNVLETTLLIDVRPVNDAPTAPGGTLNATEDTIATGTLEGSDPDGDLLQFTIEANGSLGIATVTDTATGAFTYTPHPNAFGRDSFTYRVTDSTGLWAAATVTVDIAGTNEAPVVNTSYVVITLADQVFTGTLPATDPDGDTLTFSITAQGTTGDVVLTDATTGAFTYTPFGTVGSDSFTFEVNDGTASPVQATVAVTVEQPTTFRVSTRHDGNELYGTSYLPRVSGNGKYVAFSTTASLDTGAEVLTWIRPYYLVFKDISTGVSRIISVDSLGQPVSGSHMATDVSPDGRFVVITSDARLGGSGYTTAYLTQIFLYDTVQDTTELISAFADGTPGDKSSSGGSVSNDGRYVLFTSQSSLTADDTNTWADVYLRDRKSSTTTLISKNALGFVGNSQSTASSISADGNLITFVSNANNLMAFDTVSAQQEAYLFNRATNTLDWVCGTEMFSTHAVMSADGSSIVLGSKAITGGVVTYPYFLCDQNSLTVTPITIGGNVLDTRYALLPNLTPDGRFLSFLSSLTLDPADTGGYKDIYVYDITLDRTSVASLAFGGAGGDYHAHESHSLSDDGRKVIFASGASNIIPFDSNGKLDVFMAHNPLSSFDPNADTDGDGLTNQVELTGTVTLYHVADTDGDGVNDGAEVAAGTDPLDPASF